MIPIGAIFPIDPPQQKKTQSPEAEDWKYLSNFYGPSKNLKISLIELHNDMHSHYIVYLWTKKRDNHRLQGRAQEYK